MNSASAAAALPQPQLAAVIRATRRHLRRARRRQCRAALPLLFGVCSGCLGSDQLVLPVRSAACGGAARDGLPVGGGRGRGGPEGHEEGQELRRDLLRTRAVSRAWRASRPS
jgi:hypothetical protein